MKFYPNDASYDVEDIDDNHSYRLDWKSVMRLSSGVEGHFKKNSVVLAVYPQTSVFYKAKISKDLEWKLRNTKGQPPIVDVFYVKFHNYQATNKKAPIPHRIEKIAFVCSTLPDDMFVMIHTASR